MRSSPQTVVAYLQTLLDRQRPTADDDAVLLSRYHAGRDGDAFAALVQRHGARVLGLARRIVGDEQLAEDVFQATFLLLSRRATAIQQPTSLSSWLSRTAYHLALRARRSRSRRQELEARAEPLAARTPFDELTARELLTILDAELERLPENYRWPLVLCCLEGLSQEEAARHLGCSPAAVRGRLERGRQFLRQRLAARGLTLPATLAAVLVGSGAEAVPPALHETTLRAALSGTASSPTVTALVRETLSMMMLGKAKVVGLTLLVLGVAVAGTLWLQRGLANGDDRPDPAPSAPPRAKVDLHGDPLPEGALMRLGTLKQRAVGAKLAFTADGKSVVGVRGGKYVSVWDAETGKLRETREVPGEPRATLAVSPDGRWLATDNDTQDGQLLIWDVQTAKRAHTFPVTGARYLTPVAFSPDSRHVAVVGNARSKFVRVWRLEDGKPVFATDIPTDVASDKLAFTPDGKRLLASFGSIIDQGTRCWDLASGELIWQNKEYVPPSLAFTADDKIVSAGDHPFRVVDLKTGLATTGVNLPTIAWQSQLATAPDGSLLITGTKGVVVWDPAAGKERRVLKGAGEELVLAPDGKSVLANNGTLQRWDLTTGKPLWEETFELGHAGEVLSLSITGDGKRLASASADGSVRFWDLTTGKPLHVWPGHEARRPVRVWSYMKAGVTALDLSRDGRWVLSGGSEGGLRLIDASTDREAGAATLPRPAGEGLDRRPFRIRLTPDGRRAVGLFGGETFMAGPGGGGTPTHKLAIWDMRTGKLEAKHSVPLTTPVSTAFSPDASLLVSKGTLFDVATGIEMSRLEGIDEGDSQQPFAFSDDGALIVGGCTRLEVKAGQRYLYPDGVRVWEAVTGKVVAHLKMKWVPQTAFLPGGRFVATNTLEGIRVWSVQTGEEALTRPMPEKVRSGATSGSYAGCFGFTPDGRRLVTGHPDGTLLLWGVNLPRPKPEPLADKEAESLWAELKSDDAGKAWRAVWRLTEFPDAAVPLLRERLKPVTVAPKDAVAPLLVDLDNDDFGKRQTALERLQELGPRAEAALREALEGKPSAEQRRQINRLLESLNSPARKLTADEVREVRAVTVLRPIDAPESKRLLEELSKGAALAPLTRAAQTAPR